MQAKKEGPSSQIFDQQRILLQMGRDIEKMEGCENIMQPNDLIKTLEFQRKYFFAQTEDEPAGFRQSIRRARAPDGKTPCQAFRRIFVRLPRRKIANTRI
jgi:hypothetical protein